MDIENEKVTAEDILVLATDGLWDVVSNEDVATTVQRGLAAWDNESRAGRAVSLHYWAHILQSTHLLFETSKLAFS